MTRPTTRTVILAAVVLARDRGGRRASGSCSCGARHRRRSAPPRQAPGSTSDAPRRPPPARRPTGGTATTWAVDPSIGSFADFSDSFVGYRVNETLAGNKANTAVGRTPSVSGTLALDGKTLASVQITADLSQLKSDDERRDGRLREQGIETSQFPNATFKLTQPIDLGSVPADGSSYRRFGDR